MPDDRTAKTSHSGRIPPGLGLFVFLLTLFIWRPAGAQDSVADAARNEVMRRQQMVEAAQKLIAAGAQAQRDRSYGEAMDCFRAAFESLPEASSVEATRRAVFRRYQSATLQYAQQMIDGAMWDEAESSLRAAVDLGREAEMPRTDLDPGVQRMLERLGDPDYYTRAITPQHLERVEQVKQFLQLARGNMAYGKFDSAIQAYQKVLAIDPYNKAARRGIEEVERELLNYYEVARDHTRAAQLREIASEWEMPVPQAVPTDLGIAERTVTAGRRAEIEEKLKEIIIPSIEFQQAPLSQVLDLLNQRSVELDLNEPDPSLKGVNLVIDTGTFGAGENPGSRTLSLRMANAPLGAVLQYVTRLVDATFRVDEFAVSIVSLAAGARAVNETRTWTVPPGFISQGSGGDAVLNNDPFAAPVEPSGVGGVLVTRKTAREFLEENGIVFGEGAVATYNPGTNTLLVRNTADQLRLVDNLVQTAREGVNKMVEVGVKMISVQEETAREQGYDWLLGASNLGSTPRVFFGGGTTGTGTASPFPFNNPGGGPVGLNPVTDGLRSGDLGTTIAIDDLLNGSLTVPPSQEAPAVFSVAGVFTDPQFQVVVRALSQMKGADLLCSTKLLIRPGQRGTVEVVREFIYPTEYDPPEIPNSTGGGFAGRIPAIPATPTAFEVRPLGKSIEVEPTVDQDNQTVSVDVLVDFTEFLGFINYGTPIIDPLAVFFFGPLAPPVTPNDILMPVFDAVKETTNVTVWDGQTIAIGGLYGHSVIQSADKVPLIGDLPAVGHFFRSKTERHVKRALVIFLSVRIIDPGGNPLNSTLDDESPNEVREADLNYAREPATTYLPPPAGIYEK